MFYIDKKYPTRSFLVGVKSLTGYVSLNLEQSGETKRRKSEREDENIEKLYDHHFWMYDAFWARRYLLVADDLEAQGAVECIYTAEFIE